jgi:hypothetical protein
MIEQEGNQNWLQVETEVKTIGEDESLLLLEDERF